MRINLQSTSDKNVSLLFFLKVSKGNNLISKSRAFHNVGAAYTKDLSKNELAHVLLIGGTHNTQGSQQCYLHNNMDADCKCIIILLLFMM